MNTLLEKDQILSIVPQNFRHSNKGKIIDIQDRKFMLEIFHAPEGILPKKLMEFYSQTKHGMLYFISHVMEINDNVLTISVPIKHRFLQRRAFTRIKFIQKMNLKSKNESYDIESLDLSAGGMKINTNSSLDINSEYDLDIPLLKDISVKCRYLPIKIEKNDNGSYTLSGRFSSLANSDKMKLIQFCIRKDTENANK